MNKIELIKGDCLRLYRQRLQRLEEFKTNCITITNQFECLKGEKGLYSMKFKGKKNIRIIFTFTGAKKKIAILMVSFEEKDNDKKGSKSSYAPNIEIAKKRIKEIEDMIK